MELQPPSSSAWGGQAPALDKSSRLLIRDQPRRSIAVVSQSHALIFRYSPTNEPVANGSLPSSASSARPRSGGEAGASKCMVEFSQISPSMLDDYRPLTPRPIYGTLGHMSIIRDVFLCDITEAARVAMIRPGETIEQILAVEFFCLNTSEYDNVLSVAADPWDPEPDYQGLSRRDVPMEHPCQELQKLLNDKSFYYSTDFDLTNRLQERYEFRTKNTPMQA